MSDIHDRNQFFIPPYPASIVRLLRQRGHTVTWRKNKHGSLRYRIDGGKEMQAIQMDRFYTRKYETARSLEISPEEYAQVFCTGHLEP